MKKSQFYKFIKQHWFLISTIIWFVSLLLIPVFKQIHFFWIITGLWFSLGLGTCLTPKILYRLRDDIKKAYVPNASRELRAWERIPEVISEKNHLKSHLDWFMGFVERFIFSVFVAVSVKVAIVSMGGWLALKLATSWHKRKDEDRPFIQLLIRSLALSALLVGVISLCFATVGGFLIGIGIRMIWPDFPQLCWANLLNPFD